MDKNISIEGGFTHTADRLRVVEDGLGRYNDSKIGRQDHVPVECYALSEAGAILGGVKGCLFWGWLFVDLMWVDEQHRGKGIGTALLAEVEKMALSQGITRSYLYTGSFQALEFYLRQGYVEYGRLDDMPPGHTEYYLRKNPLVDSGQDAISQRI